MATRKASGGKARSNSPATFWSTAPARRFSPQAAPPIPGLKLRHFPVDHSLYGAIAVAIETEIGWVAYTGDLRFHGAGGARTQAFVEAMAALRPAVLLCEGTRLPGGGSTTEAEVEERCLAAVREAAGQLVVADFAPRNLERLQAFVRIAAATGRRLLATAQGRLPAARHRVGRAGIDRLPGAAGGGHLRRPQGERAEVGAPGARSLSQRSIAGPRQVTAHPGEVILAFSLTDVADMLDLQLLLGGKPGGIYLFSNSQAYDEEQMVDLVRLWNWAEHLGLQLVGLEPSGRGCAR